MIRRPPRSPLFPSPPLFRSEFFADEFPNGRVRLLVSFGGLGPSDFVTGASRDCLLDVIEASRWVCLTTGERDRKSTRLNSSHLVISYAVFCLKKKKIHAEAGVAIQHMIENLVAAVKMQP